MDAERDERKIRRIIDHIPKPPFLREVRFRLDYDWTGEPAIKAIGILKNRENVAEYAELLRPYDEAFEAVIRQSGLGYFPHITYHTEAAQKELERDEKRENSAGATPRSKKVAVSP